jgi:sporulation protein YlmC with PRC-barrel domain
MADRDPSASPVISSDRVQGTAVFGTEGRQIGSIDHLIIDKASGKIVYAVMSFGGVLGMGKDEYPIPWSALTYDTSLGGYTTSITEAQLHAAPARPEDWTRDRRWAEAAHAHYGLPYYWV